MNKENPFNNSIWKKAENLLKLVEIENINLFEVPFFRCISVNWSNVDGVISQFIGRGIEKVSVRSSSDTEDTVDDSKAWAFKTLLDIDINNIQVAIDSIQKHSLNKFWYEIPIIVQEMVKNIEISWVAFSIDPDTGKNYSVFNYHSWIWEDLVSWNVSWDTVRIFNWADQNNISNSFHKKLFMALKYIKEKLGNYDIDIEYSFDGNNLFLLQVRPVTKINWWRITSNELCERYANYISCLLNKWEVIYWNMIDINPEELIWNDPIISQTFFSKIFSEWPLIDARSDMWYFRWENFMSFLLNKPYIDLEKNIKSFMPASLTNEEMNIFILYYKKLIKSDMTLQNQLDSILYPNSIKSVISILSEEWIEGGVKDIIISKFSDFFVNVLLKFDIYVKKYSTIENKLLWRVWANSFHDLLTVSKYSWSINDLVDSIESTTYYFSIFARIFFFCSNRWDNENHDFFKSAIYQNKILEENLSLWIKIIKYQMPKWFNFTSFMPQELLLDNINTYKHDDSNIINQIDISKVARENLKFIFMNMFRLLWIKLQEELLKKWLKLKDCENVPFDILMDYINWDINYDKIQFYIKKWNIKKEITSMLEFPQVITWENSLVEHKVLNEKWFFIWKWLLDWEICIINDLDEFQTKDYENKIIIIENATPEIDIYLSKIKWIITKNWWPLAHILIRSRELWIPAVVGSSYYDSLSKIDNINISIDFDNEFINIK